MTLRVSLKALREQNDSHYLVFWPDEESVSVVSKSEVRSPAPEAIMVGAECKVKVAKSVYTGKIAASGFKLEMRKLESQYIAGDWTPPFCDSASKAPETEPPAKKQRQGKGKENKVKRMEGGKSNTKQKSPKKGRLQKPKVLATILRVTEHGGMGTEPVKETDAIKETTAVEEIMAATVRETVKQPSKEQISSDVIELHVDDSNSSDAISEADPLLKVQQTQESILLRLAALEKLAKESKGVQSSGNLPHSNEDYSYSQEDSNGTFSNDDEEFYSREDSNADMVRDFDDSSHYSNCYSREDRDTYNQHNWSSPTVSSREDRDTYNQHNWLSPTFTYSPNWQRPTSIQPCPSHSSPYMHYSSPTSHFRPPQYNFQSHSFHTPQLFDSGPEGPSQPPRCEVIKPKKNAKLLPSSAICKNELTDPAKVVAKYPKLRFASKAPTLAIKLAREAFFGDRVLIQCTVMGCREFNGLPIRELQHLKQTLFNLLPQFWKTPVEFESVWFACTESVGQLCKRLRRDNPS